MSQKWNVFLFSLAFILTFSFVLLFSGVVPFVTVPTLDQAVWATGFAHSLANQSLTSFYAHNFGIPHPAPVVFGLSAILPMSWLIRLNLHASDAYTLAFALWYLVAFVGLFKLARYFKVGRYLALLLAVLGLALPVTWTQTNLSMVSLGFTLIPAYLYTAFLLSELPQDKRNKRSLAILALYLVSCLAAVFMDGYSFVMFAIGSSVILLVQAVHQKKVPIFIFFWHALCFGSAYFLYNRYINDFTYNVFTVDFFRGWGLDISFLLIPTKGVHWFWDAVGLSIDRSVTSFFGDSTTWVSTFALPLLIVAAYFAYKYKHDKRVLIFILLFLGSLYMALGPSVKFFSDKKGLYEPSAYFMPAEAAWFSTGNYAFSKYLPGFKNMRATYRWSALSFFSLWAILAIAAGKADNRKDQQTFACLVFILILLFIPNIPHRFARRVDLKNQFHAIDQDLVVPLQGLFSPNEKTVFLPRRNDFLINYIAGKLNIKVYNIGGDKNLEIAQKHWPALLQGPIQGVYGSTLERALTFFLYSGETSKVILPFFDTLAAADSSTGDWSTANKTRYREYADTILPELKENGNLEVELYDYFAVVSLSEEAEDLDIETLLPSYDYQGSVVATALEGDTLVMEVHNTSTSDWLNYDLIGAPYGTLRVGLAANRESLYSDRSVRCEIPAELPSGESEVISCVLPPSLLRNDSIVADLVYENIGWFNLNSDQDIFLIDLASLRAQ